MSRFVAFLCLALILVASSAFACGGGGDYGWGGCGGCGMDSCYSGWGGCGCGMSSCGCGGSGCCGGYYGVSSCTVSPTHATSPIYPSGAACVLPPVSNVQTPTPAPQNLYKKASPQPQVPGPVEPRIEVPETPKSSPATTGTFTLRVPADAVVIINGHRTHETGTNRVFLSYYLDPKYVYDYDVIVQANGRSYGGVLHIIAGEPQQYSAGLDVPQNTMYVKSR